MGAALSARLAAGLAAAGLDPQAVSVDELMNPVGRSGAAAQVDGALRDALAAGIQTVFVIAFVAAALALLVTFLAPGGQIAHLAARRAQGETEGTAAKPATMSD
jgi:hypothetical protein